MDYSRLSNTSNQVNSNQNSARKLQDQTISSPNQNIDNSFQRDEIDSQLDISLKDNKKIGLMNQQRVLKSQLDVNGYDQDPRSQTIISNKSNNLANPEKQTKVKQKLNSVKGSRPTSANRRDKSSSQMSHVIQEELTINQRQTLTLPPLKLQTGGTSIQQLQLSNNIHIQKDQEQIHDLSNQTLIMTPDQTIGQTLPLLKQRDLDIERDTTKQPQSKIRQSLMNRFGGPSPQVHPENNYLSQNPLMNRDELELSEESINDREIQDNQIHGKQHDLLDKNLHLDIKEEVIENQGLTQSEINQRQKFFDEFIRENSYIVPSNEQVDSRSIMLDHFGIDDIQQDGIKKIEEEENDQDQNEDMEDEDDEFYNDGNHSDNQNRHEFNNDLQIDGQMRHELKKANSRRVKVLSKNSWYIHDNILFNLEVKQGLNSMDYFGDDKEPIDQFLNNTIPAKVQALKKYKNPYNGLEEFHEFNMIDFDINHDFETLNIESNICVALYHLPEFVKIKTIDLPLAYIHRDCKLSVSNQNKLQIYNKNFVLFVFLESKLQEQVKKKVNFLEVIAEKIRQTYMKNQMEAQKLKNNSQQSTGDDNQEHKQDFKPKESVKFVPQTFVERVNFQIVTYENDKDQIINAVQLGTKGKNVKRLILTRLYWIDTYNLPVKHEYVGDHNENEHISMKNCYIANERTIVLKSLGECEYFIMTKDVNKLFHLKKKIGEKNKFTKLKLNSEERKNTTDVLSKIPRRMHFDHLIFLNQDNQNPLNSCYKGYQIFKNGKFEKIDFGYVRDVDFMRLIYNFVQDEKFSKYYTPCNQFLSMNYWSRFKQQVYSFDIKDMKFSTYQYYSAYRQKVKHRVIINTGINSPNALTCKYEKYMITQNKYRLEGYQLECVALKRQDKFIPQILKRHAAKNQLLDLKVGVEFVNYIIKRSLYGSIELQRMDTTALLNGSPDHKNDQQSNNVVSDFLLHASQTIRNTQNQLFLSFTKENSSFSAQQGRLKRNRTMILNRNSTPKNILAQQLDNEDLEDEDKPKDKLEHYDDLLRQKDDKNNELQITPCTYIFDPTVDLINRMRYQHKIGVMQGLFQQRVIYSYDYIKQKSIEELSYHQFLKCNKDNFWQAYIIGNQVILCKIPASLIGKQLTFPYKYQHQSFSINPKYIIREVVMSSDNTLMIVIYQHVNNYHKRGSLIIDLQDIAASSLKQQKIKNIRQVVEFTNKTLYVIVKHPKTKTFYFEYYELSKYADTSVRLEKQIEITNLMRNTKNQKSLSYNHYKPQSYFQVNYKNEYLIIQFDYSYYLIFKKDSFEYVTSFELSDKNLYLFFDNDQQLYLINFPGDDKRQKDIRYCQFNQGLIETIIRLSVQKLHIIVDFSHEKLSILDSDNLEVAFIKIDYPSKYQTTLLHGQNQFMETISDFSLIKYINKLSSDDIISHCDIYNSTFQHQIIMRNQKVLDAVQKRLQQTNMKSYPLFYLRDNLNQTVLDQAVKVKDFHKINIILEMIIKYQNSIYFNEVIDKHINFMLQNKFNLRDYFESDLPMQRIINSNYPNYSSDNSTIIFGSFGESDTINYIMNDYKNLVGKEVREESNKGQVQVEYFLVNMPQAITNAKFINNLSNLGDLEIYESLPIKTIIDFKWKKYAKKRAFWYFFTFLIFLISYVIDIYFFSIHNNERSVQQKIITKIICLIYMVLMEQYEVKLMSKIGIKAYLEDYWNMGDQLFAFLYLAIVVVDLTNAMDHGLPDDDSNTYTGISYMGYFIMAFRASTGDFQVDNFYELEENHIIFAWLIWISAVLFLNIILLNFIIAVISESYDKVMQRMIAESYRIKCTLIKEREQYKRKVKFENRADFPKYLILRRPVAGHSQEDIDWQGFVKDIKTDIKKVSLNQQHQLKSNIEILRSDIFERLHEISQQQAHKQETYDQQQVSILEYIKVVEAQQKNLIDRIDNIQKGITQQKRDQDDIKKSFDLGFAKYVDSIDKKFQQQVQLQLQDNGQIYSPANQFQQSYRPALNQNNSGNTQIQFNPLQQFKANLTTNIVESDIQDKAIYGRGDRQSIDFSKQQQNNSDYECEDTE
eukprot:403333675